MSDLYNADFDRWTLEQVALLKAHRFEELDIENLLEEIEDLSKRDRQALRSHLEVLLLHLLKRRCQPGHKSNSWLNSIDTARSNLDDLLTASPSLRRYLADRIEPAYTGARKTALKQAERHGLSSLYRTAPGSCPWTVEQLLDEDFYG